MSIFSDYACGALSYEEFKSLGNQMNAEDKYEQEHMYDDFHTEDEDEEEEDED